MSLSLVRSEQHLRDEALESAIRDLKRIADNLCLNDFDHAAASAYDAMVAAINSRRPSVAQAMTAARLSKIRGDHGV